MESYQTKTDDTLTTQSPFMPPCPVCNNATYTKLYSLMDAEGIVDRRFDIAACEVCGLPITLPHLPDSELKPWYHKNYHGAGAKKEGRPYALMMWAFMAIRLRHIKQYLHPGVTVVDYGAGDARFLRGLINRGVRVYGVEQDAFQPVDHDDRPDVGAILPSLDLAAQHGIFPDLVTLWHVLEHLADPGATLRRIHSALPAGGLVIIAVPNIQSGQAKTTGAHWYHLDPPRHRWHFSEPHLRRLLDTTGFEILKTNHFDLEFAPAGWWQSLLNCIHYSNGFPIHFLKRGRCRFNNRHGLAKLMDAISTILVGGFLLPLALFLSLIESTCDKGGSLMIVGRKGA